MKPLYVGACPEADRQAVQTIEDCLATTLRLPVRSLILPGVDFTLDAQRQQYSSTAVLEMVARLCPPDAAKLIAVTSRDLFIPVLTFVFGHAQLSGRAAVVSLARLRQEFYGLEPNREVFLARASKEALHETGHTFGLAHCADTRCAMSLSTGVQQIDRKSAEFCAMCARRMEIKR
jgi:archaemetzincin